MVTTQRLTAFDRDVELAMFDDDHLTRVITSTGDFYERQLLDDLLRRTKPGQVAVDVGAHIGNHTVFMAAIADLEVIAIEPFKPSVELLRTNVEANGIGAKVTIVEAAAGAKAGTGAIAEASGTNTGMTRVVMGDGDVNVTTVDAIVGRRRIAVLKVDVEGGERDVIRGASGVLRRDEPIIYVEVADAIHEREIRSVMDDLGYRFAREFNATPTRLFLPSGTSLPGLYPPFLADMATEQTRAVTDLMRSMERMERAVVSAAANLDALIRKWDGVLSRHEKETNAYREQLRKTTSLFAELYKRTSSATVTNNAAVAAFSELHESVDLLLRRLGSGGDPGSSG